MKNTLIHYVYLTTNLVNGKQYVGDHTTINIENDNYLGSGTYFKYALKEYGKENFKREILEFFPTKQEAFNAQEKYIRLYETHVSKNGYNISWKGGHGCKDCISEETKKKISQSNKGKIRTPEQRKINGDSHRGLKRSEEIKQYLSEALTNHPVSYETREKISKSHKGKSKTWLKNKPRSEEIKQQISITKKLNPIIYTEEMRLKMSNAKKGKSPWNKGLKLK